MPYIGPLLTQISSVLAKYLCPYFIWILLIPAGTQVFFDGLQMV